MKIIRKATPYIFFSFFVFCSASLSHAAGPTYISYSVDNPGIWTKENSPYIVQNHVVVKAPLTVEAGTVVKFVSSLADLNIKNNFFVNGTREAPVVFTSIHDDSDGNNSDNSSQNPQIEDWSSIIFNPSQDHEMKVKYAEIKYSSFGIHIIPSSNQTKDISVKNCQFKKNGVGILIGSAEPQIENNLITENITGIRINTISSQKTKATNNSIFGNETGAWATSSLYPQANLLEAEYNWWGDKSGPQNENNPQGKGDSVKGQLTFNPWLKEDPLQNPDPVIIIPGIMGSATKYPGGIGKLEIDPILHTYDNLIAAFEKNGYEKGKNLFDFPYEWRDSNVQTAQKLKEKIDEIKAQTGRPKVDMVAHSMGGLVARYYIEGNNYENDVDQLITLGTPHRGAPKSYLTWEAGEVGKTLGDNIMESIFKIEAFHLEFQNLREYIQTRILSVRELLPDYNYLEEASSGEMRDYPTNYPRNAFLDLLNSSGRLNSLSGVNFVNVVGENHRDNTISKFRVDSGNPDGDWIHGMPENFYDNNTNQGIEYGAGDETVPLFSAEGISSSKKITLNSSHSDLPNDSQCLLVKELTGKEECKEANIFDRVKDILFFGVFSPVDIQVISLNENKKVGKDFETGEIVNEIEGAFYSGFETKNEFITIPVSERSKGKYKVLMQGTEGGGEYKIEVARIFENPENSAKADESVISIGGIIEPSQEKEAVIEVTEDGLIYDSIPPIITILSPENGKSYSNDTYTLELSSQIADNQSGVDEATIEKRLNGNLFEGKTLDLSLMGLGSYKYEVRAKDKAGNSGLAEVNFQNTTNLSSIQNNINHYWDLGLIKKRIVRKYLTRELKKLEKLFNHLEKTENSRLKPRPKQVAIDALKKIINAEVDRLIGQIDRKMPRWFDQNIANLLTESLEYLKIN